MDEEYDVVVCGTGLKECILSGLLSVHGKNVLHLDRNAYYGGESASLNLTHLYDKFAKGTPPKDYGANRNWNVDLIPKFVMACGKLVKILLHTKVKRYLEWQVVEGTYVYQFQKAGLFTNARYIHKVPATDREALSSPLMGMLEKNRCKNFFQYCMSWNADDSKTWLGFHPDQKSMDNLYQHFGLEPNTIDFIGHAVALYTNDRYRAEPIRPTMEKIKLYMTSLGRYGRSPFIYPLYGLGGLPEGFSRLSAIHGGTYMLNTPVEKLVFDEEGKVCGVKATDGRIAKCKMVVCDPSYVLDISGKVELTGHVIRCICILSAPIPNTNDSTSCQIIIPQKQLGRQNDVYVTMVSSSHGVALKGKYIAIVSTTVETQQPEAEIRPALDLLGRIEEMFTQISPIYKPKKSGVEDNVHVSTSFDATSHFESASNDVLRIWKDMTGAELDLSIKPDPDDEQEG